MEPTVKQGIRRKPDTPGVGVAPQFTVGYDLLMTYTECIEHNIDGECEGEVSYYQTLSGSGAVYPRCEKGYAEYVERVQPQIDAVNERYPDSPNAPDWFDPTYAGESWDDDY